eukprot:COSAG06_NODE_33346_length_491_cov_0.869898_1_plen_33_part_10
MAQKDAFSYLPRHQGGERVVHQPPVDVEETGVI